MDLYIIFRELEETSKSAQQPKDQLTRMQKVLDVWQSQVFISIFFYVLLNTFSCIRLLFSSTYIHTYYPSYHPLSAGGKDAVGVGDSIESKRFLEK